MTIYDFTALNLNDKANEVWEKGIFLENYLDNDKGVNLYYLNNYFVEVTLSKPNEQIIDITPFKQGYRLEKYLERVTFSI